MVEVPVETKKAPPAPVPDTLRYLRTEMDRLFDRFTTSFRTPSWRRLFEVEPAWRYESFIFAAPAVDVIEDANAYKITAEMPGLDEKNIEVSISSDMLTLKVEKQQEKEEKDENRYLSERALWLAPALLRAPDSVDRDKIGAELRKGVLKITLPKKAAALKPDHKIEIKAAA